MMITESKETKECPICCCSQKNVECWISCPACSFSCCKKCVQKYLVSGNNLIPCCMNEKCRKQWDFEFIAENTRSDFHNKEYRDFRAKLLLQREKSLLPETQSIAIHAAKIQKIKKQNQECRRIIVENNKKLRELQPETTPGLEEKKFRYIAHCPNNDCNGYVGENWRCGLCDQKVCGKCHQAKMSKKEETYVKHICKDDDIKTANLLAKDTKPCPGCSVSIHRVSGCSQMWCTKCHTAFNWETGQKEIGVVHNPHYYEFQRRQNNGVAPRAIGDIRCGGVPNITDIARHIRNLHIPLNKYKYMYEMRQIIDHILQIELNIHPNAVGEITHQDLRIKYLNKEFDEKKWLSELKKREKKQEKDRSIHLVLRMFTDTMSDMFTNLLTTKTVDEVTNIFTEMEALRDYVNQNLNKIGERFGNKVPMINSRWQYIGLGVGYGRLRREELPRL